MSGVEVIVEDLYDHPCCVHGPTILFSRAIKNGRRNFFACSASRDRKHCSFFLWEDEKDKISDLTKRNWEDGKKNFIKGINHVKLFLTFNNVQQLSPNLRIYCNTCSSFQLPKYRSRHLNHQIIEGVDDNSLACPSEFLAPLDNPKTEAQFLFSQVATDTVVCILRKLNFRRVLCIGAPRIHECILSKHSDMTSLLLDIDKRYHHFYGPLQFCWYNMFNHYFFLPTSKVVFEEFLQSGRVENIAIVTDPPFGGRIEPLAQTFRTIDKLYKSRNQITRDLPIFWMFPYFMEPQLVNSLPEFTMLDYKVDYDNHPLFRDGPKGRKLGSPVRVFTNVDSRLIELPPEQGYKHCKLCSKWVSLENKHCVLCNACTSKDGRTYVHCAICQRCVKPTWQHCSTCRKCAQINHVCGEMNFSQECFHCKERGHKKRDCPKIDHEDLRRKRKLGIKMKIKTKRKR